MSRREKVLAAVVVGVLFILLNIFRIKSFTESRSRLKMELEDKQANIARNIALEGDRALWEQRSQWLNQSMEHLGDADVENKKIGDALLELATKHGVQALPPNNDGKPKNEPEFTSLSVGIQAKGSWSAIFDFIRELQVPGQFIVFESAKLEIDPTDKTQMKADLRVAKWYAPKPQ